MQTCQRNNCTEIVITDLLYNKKPVEKHSYEGKLIIIDNKTRTLDYGIFDTRTAFIKMTDISSILNRIYQTSNNFEVYIKIKVFNDRDKKWQKIFEAYGKLNFQNSNGVDDWFVGDCDLGSALFDNVDSYVNVTIDNYDDIILKL